MLLRLTYQLESDTTTLVPKSSFIVDEGYGIDFVFLFGNSCIFSYSNIFSY